MRTLNKSILTIALATGLSLTSQLFAANGSQLVGVSAVARGMGGTAVGGTESILETLYKNPANLSAVNFGESNFSTELGMTLLGFKSTADKGAGEHSQSTLTPIPSFAAGHSMGDFRVALGIFGYAGTNVDYGTDVAVTITKAVYKVTRIGLAGSYQLTPSISLGIQPFITYSTFQLNTDTPTFTEGPKGGFGAGVQVGALSTLTEDLTAGVNITSPSKVTHNAVIDLAPFGGVANDGLDNVSITTPWDLALGLNYKINPEWKVAADYHYFMFSTASGYRDFDWQSTSVFALGTSYQVNALALRAGFNFNLSPINNTSAAGTGSVNVQGTNILQSSQSLIDIVAFPAFTQAHITVGAGYEIFKGLDVDFSFLFAPKSTRTRSDTGYSFTGTAQQWAATLGLRAQI